MSHNLPMMISLEELNPVQRQAVECLDGPVLILAGAGTGKTRVLTYRFAHLIQTGRAQPYNILAVTFTNKAAREMNERVAKLTGVGADMSWLGTFHSIGVKILRRHAELLNLKSNFTILDTDDQIRLLKQVFESENIDTKRWPVRVGVSLIQRWKDRALTPDKVKRSDESDFAEGRLAELYKIYQERLVTLNAADFGDLLLLPILLFQQNPDVLRDYQRRFKYIMVDEYQDTNVSQYLFLRLLAQEHKNICCVGDDDQSIYSWRGAEIENILRFEKDFPGANVFRLEQNYRSTKVILRAASTLIACNQGRLGKTLWTDSDQGDLIKVYSVWDGAEEARTVSDEIESLHRKGERLSQMAILVRAGFQTREFEERFVSIGVPYRVVGGLRFYERQEIRDALAYLRVVAQPEDGLAFERIINVPRRGVGAATLTTVHHHARSSGISFMRAVDELIDTDEVKPQQRKSLRELLNAFARWRQQLQELPHGRVAEIILDESGYTEMWMKEKSPDAPARLENLKELIRAIDEFQSLQSFLEHVSLVTEQAANQQDDMVTIMTLHSAKGLEYDMVFLPGWEEGVFPHQKALDESGDKALEEERRLAYVGLTRARKRVFICHAANRRIHNQWQSSAPSRFIEELPTDVIDSVSFLRNRNQGYHPALREYAPKPVSPTLINSPVSLSGFRNGDRVFHLKFGYGRVCTVEGDKLDIAFDKAGYKKVMQSFVQKA